MKRILVVEDTIAQIATVESLLRDKGYQYLIAQNLAEAQFAINTGNFDGVLTDLHFPEKENADGTPPCGLSVLVLCTERSVPVAVVSDINHHFAAYATIVVSSIAKLHPIGKIPFIMDSKNWSHGLQLLEEML